MRRYKALVTEIKNLTPSIVEITMVRRDGADFPDFLPGQYATLSFPNYERLKGERSFSIASAPTDRSRLRFGIRIGGRYTSALRRIRMREPVIVAGPFGKFTFDPDRDRSAVFIAGGIGITPFLSMIRAATDLELKNELTLIYSVRSMNDAAYMQELNELERINPHLRVTYAISDEKVPGLSERLVPGRINPELIDKMLPGNMWGYSFFLCGPPPFMDAMTAALRTMGLPASAVMTERFGIGSSDFIERGTPIPKLIFAGWGVAAMIVLGIIVKVEQTKRANAIAANPTPITNVTPDTTLQNTGSQVQLAPANPTYTYTPQQTQPQPTYRSNYIRPRTTMS